MLAINVISQPDGHQILYSSNVGNTIYLQYQLSVSLIIPQSDMPSLIMHLSVSQKTIHLTFDHNVRKCRPISKSLSLADSQRNCLCNCYRVFRLALTVLPHCLWEIKKFEIAAESLLIPSKFISFT